MATSGGEVQLMSDLSGQSEAPSEPENPLFRAISDGDHPKFNEILSKSPELVKEKNKVEGGHSSTALHLATLKGNHQMVRSLSRRHPKLCQVRDSSSRTPLQVALETGACKEVISDLVSAYPKSLHQVTERKETVFVIALKSGNVDAFEVLLEEAKKRNQVHLLDRKDKQGNNVLHVAASKKLSKVVKMLVPRGPTSDTWVRMNSLNKEGKTAMDICDQGPRDKLANEIHQILRSSGARAGHNIPVRARIASTLATKNVILVVIVTIIGASFTAVCNIPGSFLEDKSLEGAAFHARDLVESQLPPVFYLLVFNTAIFMVAMLAILVILWRLPLWPMILFVNVTIAIVYCILVANVLPNFWVTLDHRHRTTSTVLVFTLAVAFICSSAVVYYFFYGIYMCLCGCFAN